MTEIDVRKERLVQVLSTSVGTNEVSVVDVGCGDCRYYDVLTRYLKVSEYLGIDRSPRCGDKPTISVDLEVVKPEMYSEYFNRYDIAVMFDILEHITNYGLLLDFVNALLKKNGYALISTIAIPIDNIRDAIERDIDHVHLYTPTLLSRALSRHGFAVMYTYQDHEILYAIARKVLNTINSSH